MDNRKSIKIDTDLWHEFKVLAAKSNKTIQELVGKALKEYLKKVDKVV